MSPATEALNEALKIAQTPVISKESPMISPTNLKRSRSSMGSFDMSDFDFVAQQVEDEIAFPSIEFPGFDDDSEGEEDYSAPPAPKRRCGGLVRSSNASFDLSSLSARRGSLC